jgi:tetratricopeptide (TPR) repeat protein
MVHLYMRSSPASAKGNNKPAVLSVVEATQRVPKDARKAYEHGLKFREDKKLDRAMTSFDEAVRFYPDYFQALAARGDLHISTGKIAEASEDFDQALKFNEAYGPALRGAGFCKLQQQQFNEAARYLVRALETDANDASSHLYLGITLIALNQSELAKEAFQQALKIDAEAAMTAHIYMADIHARNRRFKAAADELQIYLKARPKAPNADKLKTMEADFRARSTAQQK